MSYTGFFLCRGIKAYDSNGSFVDEVKDILVSILDGATFRHIGPVAVADYCPELCGVQLLPGAP
jgi:hypothetical protein